MATMPLDSAPAFAVVGVRPRVAEQKGSAGLLDVRSKRLLVIGGAGLIGSHTVDALTREDVAEIVVYDNFVRGVLWPNRHEP